MNRTHRNLNTAKAPNENPRSRPKPNNKSSDTERPNTFMKNHLRRLSHNNEIVNPSTRPKASPQSQRVRQTRNQKKRPNNFMKRKAIKADFVHENQATSTDDLK